MISEVDVAKKCYQIWHKVAKVPKKCYQMWQNVAKGVPRGFKGFQGVSKGSKGFQGVPRGSKGKWQKKPKGFQGKVVPDVGKNAKGVPRESATRCGKKSPKGFQKLSKVVQLYLLRRTGSNTCLLFLFSGFSYIISRYYGSASSATNFNSLNV